MAGALSALLAELFPTKIRNTASAVGYNISFALFGGAAPLIAITLVNYTKNLMGCAVVSTIAVLFVKDGYKDRLLSKPSLHRTKNH